MKSETLHDILHKEVKVSRRLWSARQVVVESSDPEGLDRQLGARADRSLQHVFHLLALRHPVRPLRVAFRGLHTDDAVLRGTALEYLVSILPPRVFGPLSVVLGEDSKMPARSPEDALESLLASHASIEVNLDELAQITPPLARPSTD